MTITFENVSDEQFRVIDRALELYSRILSGHTSCIGEELDFNGIRADDGNDDKHLFRLLALSRFDGIDGYGSHLGISESCDNAKQAYDIYKELRFKSGREHEASVYKFEPRKLIASGKFKITFSE